MPYSDRHQMTSMPHAHVTMYWNAKVELSDGLGIIIELPDVGQHP